MVSRCVCLWEGGEGVDDKPKSSNIPPGQLINSILCIRSGPSRPAPSAFYCSLHLAPSGKETDGISCHVELQMENPDSESLCSPHGPGPVALAGEEEAAPSPQPRPSAGMGTQHSSPARLLPPGRDETLPFPTPSPTIRIAPLLADLSAGSLSHLDLLPICTSTLLLRNGPGCCRDVPILALETACPLCAAKPTVLVHVISSLTT